MDIKEIISKFINEVDIDSFVWRYYINTFAEGWMMPQFHHHRAIELIHVIDGYGFMKFDNDVEKLSKNNCLLIMPECEHRFYVDNDRQCTLVNLHFIIDDTPLEAFEQEGCFFSGIEIGRGGYKKFSRSEQIGAAMKAIVSSLSSKQNGYGLSAALSFGQLFVELSRAGESRFPPREQTGKELVKRIEEYIDANLSEEISPAIIAKELHFTSNYLMHIFKNAADMSLMEFVRKKRIETSKELLSGGDQKISDISAKVGISNAQHFSSMFKKYTGMAPKEFRKMALLKNNTDTNIFK